MLSIPNEKKNRHQTKEQWDVMRYEFKIKDEKKTAHTTHENELKRRENKEQFSSISLNLWLFIVVLETRCCFL